MVTRHPLQRGDIELWALGAVGVLVGLGAAFAMGYTEGGTAARHQAQVEASRVTIRHLQALNEANRREALLEETMTARLAAREREHTEELARVQKERDRFAADVRAGAVRLSIPVVAASCPAATRTDSGAANLDRHEARAELAPETGLALVAIADEGDAAIRQLGQCIDAYNDVRLRLNGHAGTDQAVNDAQAQ
jgi:hypothetical protein